jgi:hypothetical protein
VARGHDVVCATRGRPGEVPGGAELIVVDRDRDRSRAAGLTNDEDQELLSHLPTN